jgi:hypothetical protein
MPAILSSGQTRALAPAMAAERSTIVEPDGTGWNAKEMSFSSPRKDSAKARARAPAWIVQPSPN